jgi:DNA polymerase II small subunit/DNA polymerase delta subunit B
MSKWKSRKFWESLIAQIGGCVSLIWGCAAQEKYMIIAGAVVAIVAALGYLKTEGDIDKLREGKQ